MADVDDLLTRLAQGLAQGADAGRPLPDRLCASAARILDCDGGAITLAYTHVERVTLSATDDTALALEEAQDVMGQGPGHDAFTTGAYARFDLLDVDGPDPRWPMLESNALTALAPLVVHALPMGQGEDRVIGVLTLYQRGTDRSIDLDAALIVARVLAAALLADEPTVHHTGRGAVVRAGRGAPGDRHGRRPARGPRGRRARPAPGPRVLARPERGPQRPRGARAPRSPSRTTPTRRSSPHDAHDRLRSPRGGQRRDRRTGPRRHRRAGHAAHRRHRRPPGRRGRRARHHRGVARGPRRDVAPGGRPRGLPGPGRRGPVPRRHAHGAGGARGRRGRARRRDGRWPGRSSCARGTSRCRPSR